MLDGLRRRGVQADAVDGIPALVAALAAKRIDRVFNILHGQRGGGEDGVVQGLLEAFGVPYTGLRRPRIGALDGQDPHQAGVALRSACRRRATSDSGRLTTSRRRRGRIGLPVVVKPSNEGSSVGVSRVKTDAQLSEAIALARRYPGELLMEELIEGDEYTVGVLGEEALPSIRIVPAGEYYDYHAKYVAETTQYICPGLDGQAEAEIGALALQAFGAAGCRGWGRVDVMRDRSGRNFLLEINTSPGMTSHSLVPKAARAVGIDFDELVWRILEMTVTGTNPIARRALGTHRRECLALRR